MGTKLQTFLNRVGSIAKDDQHDLIAWLVWAVVSFGVLALWKGFESPDAAKWILIPIGLSWVFLRSWGRIREIALGDILVAAFLCWGFVRITPLNGGDEAALGLVIAILAFSVGRSRATPPGLLLDGVGALCIVRGWMDLILAKNLGEGIPLTATSFFVHKNMFGFLLAPFLVYQLGRVVQGRPRRWMAMILLGIGLPLLIVVDCRGAQLGFCVGIAVLLLATFQKVSWRKVFWGWLVLMSLLVGGIALLPQAKLERLTGTWSESRDMFAQDSANYGNSASFRRWAWAASMGVVRDHPFVGCGIGAFQHAVIPHQEPWLDRPRYPFKMLVHAHGHFFETAASQGVPAVVAEILILLAGLCTGWRRQDWVSVALLSGMTTHMVVAEASEYPASIALIWWLIGWLLSTPRRFVPIPLRWWLIVPGLFVASVLFLHVPGWLRYQMAGVHFKRTLDPALTPEQVAIELNKTLECEPRHPDVGTFLGNDLGRRGEYDTLMMVFRRIDAWSPGDKAIEIFIAKAFEHKQNFDSAIYYARIARLKHPYYLPNLLVLGQSYAKSGRCTELAQLKSTDLPQLRKIYEAKWDGRDSLFLEYLKREALKGHLTTGLVLPLQSHREVLEDLAYQEWGHRRENFEGIRALDAMGCP